VCVLGGWMAAGTLLGGVPHFLCLHGTLTRSLACYLITSPLLHAPLPCLPLTPQVHTGFLTAYDSIRPAVLDLLTLVLDGQEDTWRLYFTGCVGGGAGRRCTPRRQVLCPGGHVCHAACAGALLTPLSCLLPPHCRHSLGGALATLCAWDCSHRRCRCVTQPPSCLPLHCAADLCGGCRGASRGAAGTIRQQHRYNTTLPVCRYTHV
jgi:hypothetical protein